MKMKRIQWVLAVTVLLLSGCFSRFEVYPEIKDPALMDKKFSVTQLKSDLDFMVDSYKSRHPDWQGRVSLAQLDRVHQSLTAQIVAPMNRQDYFKIIGQLTQTLRDGHSGILFPYPEYDRFMAAGGKVFPLELRLDEQLNAFVKAENKLLPVGTQITTINGQPIDKIISHLATYARGETEQLRANIVVRELSKWLWHIYDFKSSFEVSYVANGQSASQQLTGFTKAQFSQDEDDDSTGDLRYTVLDDNIGLMSVDYFGVSEDTFESYIDDTFAKINQAQINSVIIDIRENPGGSTDNVEYLMQYIIDKPCKMVSQVKEKLYEDGMLSGKKGDLEEVSVDTEVSPIADSKRFKGDVYLLISKFSYSASIVMATAVQDCDVGTLVGQATGGFANQTGQINFFELPHTQLRGFIPSRLMVRPNGDLKTQPVTPDVIVESGLNNTTDNVIEHTRALINSKK